VTPLSLFPAARRILLPKGGWLNVHQQPGKGHTLLLLHGFTDCAESFRLIAPHFAGRHLVIPDLRGHGGSFRNDLTDLSDFASDLEDMSEELGLNEVVLVGHSMGTLISLLLAVRHRMNIQGLVLLSGSVKPASPALSQIVDQFALLPSPLSPDHPFLDDWYACSSPVARPFIDRLKASCIAMRPQDWMSCLSLVTRADLGGLAQTIKVPALSIYGGQDPIFPPDHQEQLQRSLRPSQVLFLPDVGHNPHWEAPVDVANAINTFVSTLGITP
jgi:pimeloyl-ACP methyl ester carboxylesterase